MIKCAKKGIDQHVNTYVSLDIHLQLVTAEITLSYQMYCLMSHHPSEASRSEKGQLPKLFPTTPAGAGAADWLSKISDKFLHYEED